jgi:hypothetical protein
MFEPFQNFMNIAAGRFGVYREVKAADICQKFRTLVPDLFPGTESPGESVSPAFYKDSILVINVASSAWAQEVVMRKEKIIAEMNDKIGQVVVKNLRAQLK